jgi:hypothetical protein
MGFPPRSVFYMAVPISNRDGTIDEPDANGVRSALAEDDAVRLAGGDVEDSGGVMIVYRCVPMRCVSAYRVKVENIEVDDVAQNAHRVVTEAVGD